MTAPQALAGRSGQVVVDRYELLEVVGTGGQSVVYRAHDRYENAYVALKICESPDPQAAERMYREAFIMSQLENTAAVRVLHQCTTDDGKMVIVMELLSGSDLASVLHMREGRGQVAERSWLMAVLEPIVRTLGHAHDRGIVHRDIKAENVFVLDPQSGGGVRLLDFGFAKMARMPQLTEANIFAGSVGYAAPEVWRLGAARADARADVYSFGVLVFRMLAGRMPFEGTMLQLAGLVLSSERPSLHALRPDLPTDIDPWIRQVLAIDPDRRFARIAAAWRALEACLEPA